MWRTVLEVLHRIRPVELNNMLEAVNPLIMGLLR